MIPNYPDEKIITSIKASTEAREQVLSLLFNDQELQRKAFAVIYPMVKDEAIKVDIFADSLLVFIKVIAKNEFQRKSNLTTYFIGICKNLSLRHLEKLKKKKEHLEKYKKEILSKSESIDNIENLFLIDNQKRYEKKLTQRIYKQLSDTCRQYFRNKFGKAMTVKEIAIENKVKEQSVKNTLSRCYQKLRELIQNDPEVMEQIKRNYGKL